MDEGGFRRDAAQRVEQAAFVGALGEIETELAMAPPGAQPMGNSWRQHVSITGAVRPPAHTPIHVQFASQHMDDLEMLMTMPIHLPPGGRPPGVDLPPGLRPPTLRTVQVYSGDAGPRMDGNDVDLDRQMVRMAQNTLYHNAMVQILTQQFNVLKGAISGRV